MEEETLNPKSKKENHVARDVWWLVGILVLGFVGWQILQIRTVSDTSEPSVVAYETPGNDYVGLPQGRIYMTLFSVGDSDLRPYVFDVARNQFSAVPVDDFSVALHQTFSGQHTAFVGTTRAIYDAVNSDADAALQVYSSAIGSGTAIAQVDRSERRTETSVLGKRSISLSEDGTQILFGAYERGRDTLPTTADEWGIYFVDGSNDAQKIADGMYPNWVDANNFIYLKKDGVYMYDMRTDVETVVWNYSGETQTNMMMHLSEDRRTLAWTLPGNGLVLVLRVTSVEEPNLEQIAQISTNAFWPVVSPDGNFVAVQAVNWETLTEDPQPRIELYSVQERGNPQKLRSVLDLGAFDQTRLFVTDWRK